MVSEISVENRKIGWDHPCFVIAEAGVNHNGNLHLAKKLINAAASAGADAVKFQTFSADKIILRGAPKADYQNRNTTENETQFQMLKKLELTEAQFKVLSDHSRRKKILFLSTPFDSESVEILENLKIPAYKISSGELTNFPLLRIIASKKKPVIVSTGMATLDEVAETVSYLKKKRVKDLAILHCTSDYPASIDDVNLRVIDTLYRSFNLPVGYSDHTIGIFVPLLAVARGACIIEKHITLDKNLPGPDHQASLDPEELKDMVLKIRMVERALGSGEKKPTKSEETMRKIARKSLVAAKKIGKGTTITADMIECKRPGSGISPRHLPEIISTIAKRTIPEDTLITWDMIE